MVDERLFCLGFKVEGGLFPTVGLRVLGFTLIGDLGRGGGGELAVLELDEGCDGEERLINIGLSDGLLPLGFLC